MQSVRFPYWISKLMKEVRTEYPEVFLPFHYDEWDTMEQYAEDLKNNLIKAREAQKNGTLEEFIKELHSRPSKAADKFKKKW